MAKKVEPAKRLRRILFTPSWRSKLWLFAFQSKEKLQAHLANARIARAGHVTKQAAVEVPVWIIELRVVEGVKELGPELQRQALEDSRVFVQRQVPIVETGPVEKLPVGIPESAERARDEARLGEELVGPVRSGQPRILSNQRAHETRDVSSRRTEQRTVAAL